MILLKISFEMLPRTSCFTLKTLVVAILLVLFFTPLFSQTDIVWSEPIQVSTTTFGASSPKLAMLSNGELVAVWGKSSGSPKIYFSRKVADSFEPPVQLSTGGIVPDIYGFGGLGLAAFNDKVFIIFENFDSGIHLLRSEDGGQTFSPPVNVFDPPVGDWTTLATVTTDGQGNPIVSVIRELATETEARYIVLRSEDGGATFLPPVVGSEPANGEYVCECCPSDMVVAGDSVWLVFRNNDNNLRDVWVSRSTDAGASFDTATDVDATDWVVNACPISGPRLQRIGNDSLLAVWMSGASGQGRIFASTLHGGTMDTGWQFDFPATNGTSLQSFPSIAGSADTLCIVWEETGFGTNAAELLFRFSTTGAAGLSAYQPTQVAPAPGNQRYPDLVFDDSVFHLIYQTGGGLEYRRGVMAIINAEVEKVRPEPHFELLANPTSDFVSVKMNTSGNANFTLVSSMGQVVQTWPTQAVAKGQTLQLALPTAISSGVYFLKIEKDGLRWSEKLLVN